MHATLRLLAMAAVMTVVGAAAAQAKLTVANRADKSVWLTVYNSFGQQITSQCLPVQGMAVWNGGFGKLGARGELVYVRGELKEGSNCGGKTLSDTGRGATISVGSDTVKAFTVVGNSLHVG